MFKSKPPRRTAAKASARAKAPPARTTQAPPASKPEPVALTPEEAKRMASLIKEMLKDD